MAVKRLAIDGYGQLELNQVTFRRDGRIEAQCALDDTDFTKAAPAENGMILAIDQISRTVKLPTESSGSFTDELFGLNYTTEHMYDDRANALKDFALEPGTFLPRLGILTIGEKFTTNTISYDTTAFTGADDDAQKTAIATAIEAGTVYGGASADGSIFIAKTKSTKGGPILKAVKATTMPDGTFGIKFQVIAD